MGYQNRRYSEGAVRRKKIAYYQKGPGPNAFLLPGLVGKKGHAVTHLINPEYSIRGKFPFKPLGIGPGAGAYQIYGLKAGKEWDAAPAYTMRIRTKTDFRHEGPGPGNYKTVNTDVYKFNAPKFSMNGKKENESLRPSRIRSPAPNAYMLPPAIGPRIPDRIAAPEITLKGRRGSGDDPVDAIRRVSYKIPSSFPGPPAFSLGRRWPEPKINSFGPSPQKYSPEKCQLCRSIGTTFKYRYNDFTGILRTECDNSPFTNLD